MARRNLPDRLQVLPRQSVVVVRSSAAWLPSTRVLINGSSSAGARRLRLTKAAAITSRIALKLVMRSSSELVQTGS